MGSPSGLTTLRSATVFLIGAPSEFATYPVLTRLYLVPVPFPPPDMTVPDEPMKSRGSVMSLKVSQVNALPVHVGACVPVSFTMGGLTIMSPASQHPIAHQRRALKNASTSKVMCRKFPLAAVGMSAKNLLS